MRRGTSRALGALLLAFALSGCHRASSAPAPATPAPEAQTGPAFFGPAPDGKLHLYFFDVGRGSATLVVSPTGKTALIDAGPASESGHLIDRLPELLRSPLDWVVVTDPRPERMGGLSAVLARIGAKGGFDSGVPCVDSSCAVARSEIAEAHLKSFSLAPDDPGAPRALDLGGGAKLEVLWPRAPTEPLLPAGPDMSDVNALVTRLVYRHTSVLFASDMRSATEAAVLADHFPLRSTLLVVGDHGSDRASSSAFLLGVLPQAAVLTPGPGEDPSDETLARLKAVNAALYRTDRDGEIQAVSDGERLTVTTERALLGKGPSGPRSFSEATRKPPPTSIPTDADLTQPPSTQEASPSERASPEPPRAASAAIPRGARYVASRHSHVFHRRDCRTVRRIKPENRVYFKTFRQALASHRKPSQDCLSGARGRGYR